ncbi:CitMHS family citrate-Mg2+:H+ or citrate-Ca2+:H+ symporter [Breoghania corrubedonensis]|uniref:CitMHS family citrate-Mg2+:H+ or citrate-Ca2+:H+ symporter n=1 Tax=Breoghania corrubedonensis TaxID=665038 RepID=A0A2T5USE8_9HYPH|nr:citrate:proton symporter [Breoghania corrubedonensis]PTW54381.1 CitMHS family citrate-Mg2+:H+ or citrate-Ca2+:H+ symporter [Breoghania corrubedonensis]
MLALLGLGTIVLLLASIMTNKLSPLVALITIPLIAALIGGFGLESAGFMVKGIKSIAPVATMFVFAIVFFGILSDAGMMDPIIDRILKVVGMRPSRITVGTALLATIVHLDGSGAVTFLVTIPAMLPLYDRLKMRRVVLAAIAAMAAGTANMLPWGGPTLRAAASLHVNVTDVFNPMIGVQIIGLLAVFAIAYVLGLREEKRLGASGEMDGIDRTEVHTRELTDDEQALRRPKLFLVNVALTLAVLGAMISGLVPAAVSFMLGTVIALLVNYPKPGDQKNRIDAHAKAALMMATILFAAGAFTGIMRESGMLTAMAQTAAGFVSEDFATHMPVMVGMLSMPLSLLFDPDSYYFGVMPVIAEVYQTFGGNPIAIGQASIIGQMTTGFPVSPLTASTFLLIGLSGVSLGEHQRFTIPLVFAVSVIMTVAAVILGVLPF